MLRISVTVATLLCTTAAFAQSVPGALPEVGSNLSGKAPVELQGAQVIEKLESRLPLDTVLRDENGRQVELGRFFQDGLPVILTFNYSNCPLLCSVQLGGLVDVLRQMDWKVGQQFRIITVSLDPKEPIERTRKTKSQYLQRYSVMSAQKGWQFLVADKETLNAIASSVGYGFQWVKEQKEVSHPAALVFLSPSGVVTRYVYGVDYKPETMVESLNGAVLGRADESPERFLLACFHYDSSMGSSKVARDVMKYGGIAFLFGLLGIAAVNWRGRRNSLENNG